MSSTHTPGPWTATKGRTQWNVRAPNLHMTLLDTRHGHPELKKANAMLAAAAPDLLAACEAAVEAIEQNIDDEDTDDGAPTWAQALHMQLQAAISKARGTT